MLYKADQTSHLYLLFHKCAFRQLSVSVDERVRPGPDLPIGLVGLSQEPQDPRGPPANCGTHRVNCLCTERYPLLNVNQAKELAVVRAWYAPDQSFRLYCR